MKARLAGKFVNQMETAIGRQVRRWFVSNDPPDLTRAHRRSQIDALILCL